MSLEVFVRASGAVMGLARDSFSLDVGGGAGSGSGSVPVLAGAVSGSGQAVLAFNNASTVVDGQVSVLGEQNVVGSSELASAVAAAGAGRQQMETVIAAAVGDVNRLAAATTTPAGQQSLVNALAGRLEQTWQALTDGHADASTRAASSAQLTAAYSGLGTPSGTGIATTTPMASSTMPMSSMAALSPLQSAAMMQAETMAANQAAISQATQLASLQQQANTNTPTPTPNQSPTPTGTATHPGAPPEQIPVSAVQYQRGGFASGHAAYTDYINKTLDLMGITDKTARQNWLTGLLHGSLNESSWNPSAVNSEPTAPTNTTLPDGYLSTCARGGLQTIPSTFAANHQPGTSNNIYDPVANTAASMNYLMSRYHVLRDGSNLSSVQQFNPNDGPSGGY